MTPLIVPALGFLFIYLLTREASAMPKPSTQTPTPTPQPSRGTIPATGKPTRGERNNNPGNIRINPAWTWQGQMGADSGGYVIFNTVENGVRAMTKDLKTKIARGLNTIAKIIPVYAPEFENPTSSYISRVSEWAAIPKDKVIDPSNKVQMLAIISAMIRFENGRVSYAPSVIMAGINSAG